MGIHCKAQIWHTTNLSVDPSGANLGIRMDPSIPKSGWQCSAGLENRTESEPKVDAQGLSDQSDPAFLPLEFTPGLRWADFQPNLCLAMCTCFQEQPRT